MLRKIIIILTVCCVIPVGTSAITGSMLSPEEELGKKLFFDANLSTPPGQSCSTCHAPEAGWTSHESESNLDTGVYHGAVHTRFGNRKAPSSAYASFSPALHYNEEDEVWVGGQFWDGRANSLIEQAKGPFLNPLEQNNSVAKQVCIKVAKSDYAWLFKEVYGPNSLNFVKDVEGTYDRIARAIAAYEASSESEAFTSKYDYYVAQLAELTEQEAWGLELFNGKAMCSACHPSEPGPYSDKALFTDYTYDNLGIPKNPNNPFYSMPKKWNPDGKNWVDLGLGFTTGQMSEYGLFKVPTLRNVDKRPYPEFVKSYGHNGYFKSLKEIVHFYNTRDVAEWPAPEVAININEDELGNLGLTDEEEDAIVAFMQTLTDGYQP